FPQQAAQKDQTLVVTWAAQTRNQIVHTGPQGAGLRSFGNVLDPDPRLLGEGGPQEQKIHHGIQIALFQTSANRLVLALAPGRPLGFIWILKLGGQAVTLGVQNEFHAGVGGEGMARRDDAQDGGEDERNRSETHSSSKKEKARRPVMTAGLGLVRPN